MKHDFEFWKQQPEEAQGNKKARYLIDDGIIFHKNLMVGNQAFSWILKASFFMKYITVGG